MPIVIKFEGVSKSYRLGPSRASLREALAGLPKRLIGRGQAYRHAQNLWALRDVSFAVRKGEVLGVIGPNGSGKTTTLKLLSAVTKPSSGHIETTGRISALIELGAGFHPDLTGRENIFLNGVILGLSRNEITRKLDGIVSFAGLEKFIDTPVKRYSSGMYVRLGFAVAAHVDPEILLIDEVLAVGDQEFRVRCIDRFRELQSKGVTTVIVSHNRQLIESLCSRVIYLQGGCVVYEGEASAAWDAYLSASATQRLGLVEDMEGKSAGAEMTITRVQVLGSQGEPALFFAPGEAICASIEFQVHQPVEDPVFYARWYRDGHLIHGTNSARFGIQGRYETGDCGVARIDYEALHLLDGTYELSLGIERSFFSRASYDRAPSIRITVGGEVRYGVGIVHLPHAWRVKSAN
jgi:ABC-type polysaccharide/polyol phosphate transport system ATPase subunit